MKLKKNQFEINNEVGYKHVIDGKTFYCIKCNDITIEKLKEKLNNMYESVQVYKQLTWVVVPVNYYEIACI